MSTEPKWAKPLQWEASETEAGSYWSGNYSVWLSHTTARASAMYGDERLGMFDSESAAKAACQAHHEAQVRALMTDAASQLYEALAKCHAFFVSAGWEREPLSIEVSAALAKARGES